VVGRNGCNGKKENYDIVSLCQKVLVSNS
jgi:hypothetical protein